MTPPGTESKTPRDLQEEDDLDEAVDYESDIDFIGSNESPITTITGEDHTSRASSPFLERGAADTLTALRTSPDMTLLTMVNTNPLDEQQQQIVASEESAKHRSATMSRLAGQRDYVFRAS